jgi:hypothetical protein
VISLSILSTKIRTRIISNETQIHEVIEFYTEITGILLEYLANEIKESDNSDVWRYSTGN